MSSSSNKSPTRDTLLERLREVQGSWISGQFLSRELSISRTAVSKNIQTLIREGYRIQTATKKGYRLMAVPDRLFGAEIKQNLNTRIFGRQEIHHYEVIPSTNIRARELAEKGAPEGTLVIAESQTAGRGRRGRLWVSPQKGGIYLSLIARPQLSPSEAPQITLLTAVALANAIMGQTDLLVQIKWPNDLLIERRKLSGILTELHTEGDLVDYVVVGVGVNVNTTTEALSTIRDQKATSIAVETGKRVLRLKVLRAFLLDFEYQYTLLATHGFSPILERWKTLANIVGRIIRVDMAGGTVKGRVVDIEQTGVLIIKSETGEVRRVFSGDVRIEKNESSKPEDILKSDNFYYR
jgi:BirA family biotin operon repressor/biotin-[acetyl-CoA-carboxylase] ligase